MDSDDSDPDAGLYESSDDEDYVPDGLRFFYNELSFSRQPNSWFCFGSLRSLLRDFHAEAHFGYRVSWRAMLVEPTNIIYIGIAKDFISLFLREKKREREEREWRKQTNLS